jgi:hypothetical protein
MRTSYRPASMCPPLLHGACSMSLSPGRRESVKSAIRRDGARSRAREAAADRARMAIDWVHIPAVLGVQSAQHRRRPACPATPDGTTMIPTTGPRGPPAPPQPLRRPQPRQSSCATAQRPTQLRGCCVATRSSPHTVDRRAHRPADAPVRPVSRRRADHPGGRDPGGGDAAAPSAVYRPESGARNAASSERSSPRRMEISGGAVDSAPRQPAEAAFARASRSEPTTGRMRSDVQACISGADVAICTRSST